MNQPPAQLDTGFTVVELLVTLFIAALFIASGYQLYAFVTRDSADSREQSIASNIGYKTLRKYQSSGLLMCPGTVTPPAPANTTLPEPVVVQVKSSLPYGGNCSDDIYTLQVDVSYGSPAKKVSQAIYVNN